MGSIDKASRLTCVYPFGQSCLLLCLLAPCVRAWCPAGVQNRKAAPLPLVFDIWSEQSFLWCITMYTCVSVIFQIIKHGAYHFRLFFILYRISFSIYSCMYSYQLEEQSIRLDDKRQTIQLIRSDCIKLICNCRPRAFFSFLICQQPRAVAAVAVITAPLSMFPFAHPCGQTFCNISVNQS
jgi:hypothetical protein